MLAYDGSLGLLYVAAESGPLSRFKVSANGVARIGNEVIGNNAHVVAVDPEGLAGVTPWGVHHPPDEGPLSQRTEPKPSS